LETDQPGYSIAGHRGFQVSVMTSEVATMIILGLILLVVGFFTGISILTTLGVILLVIGVILAILGATGRAIGGRAHWY
jgi:membrane-bound ClpP family serine protease